MGEICFVLLFFLTGYFLWTAKWWRGSGKKEIMTTEDENDWYRIYANGVKFILIAGRKHFHWRIKGERFELLKKLYVGKNEKEIFYHYYTRTGCILSMVITLFLVLVVISGLVTKENQLLDGYFLKREGALGQEKTIDLSAAIDGNEREVTIEVPNICYTSAELAQKLQEAKEYVNRNYLGENSTPDRISEPLCLMTSIPDSAIIVEWQLGIDELVQEDGSISNENLEESQQTEITAVLLYGEKKEFLTKQLTILPRQKTREEQYWDNWKRQLEINQEDSLTKEYLRLPQQVEGKTVSYHEKQISISNILLGGFLFGIAAVFLLREEKFRKELEKRERELRTDYPEFLEHFVLLIGAGLNIKGAWERIVCDYQETKQRERRHYVYEEMLVSVHEMENGMSEARAYELFGKRMGLLQYMKFCTLIVQNLKKGSDDLLHILEYEVADAFRERKDNAKALGEEAGTKLLLPMMLMLVIVFVLILYAAFYNM